MERRGGGSVLTLTYLGSQRVFTNYNVMGVAKAALEASVRYLASDLGTRNIRVNAISAGPIKTLAAAGISGFSNILQVYRERAPLRRNVELAEVADAALFLLGPGSRAVTGEVLMRSPVGARDGVDACRNSMSEARMERPGADSAARDTVLSSSRMLPGQ